MTTHTTRFLRDEQGGYTIWSLCWFLIYCAIGGLAVDVTNAYRNQELLQSTADAASLAAVISLPDEANAVAQAIAYSEGNMSYSVNGVVLEESDVTVGTWNAAARTFTPGGAEPNAVKTVTRRSTQNDNPVKMSVLRIAAFFGMVPEWDISTEAIATRFVPGCLNDGFVAKNQVDINSNNDLLRNICIHGQILGVDLQNHNYFEPGVRVSMPNLDLLPDRDNLYDMNSGLANALTEGDVYPRDVEFLPTIIQGLRDLNANYIPNYMYRKDANGDVIPPSKYTGTSLPGTLNEFTVYDITCNGQEKLPTNTLVKNVVVITSCRMQAPSDFSSGNVILASSAPAGSNASIDMAAKSALGQADNCAPGGGVELYAMGDIHISAQGDWNGLRIVSGHDVKMTSNNNGIYGISVQAGNNIDFSSNNDFGLCGGGVPGRFAWHHRLVR